MTTPSIAEDVRILRRVRSSKAARVYLKRARYARVNARRGDLIHRDVFGHDLTADEQAELEVLQKLVLRITDLAFPFRTRDRVRAVKRPITPKRKGD